MIKNEDERAFPVTMEDGRGQSMTNLGMTLRDYFAAKAMAPLLDEKGRRAIVMGDAEGFAAACYLIADAMLAARSA